MCDLSRIERTELQCGHYGPRTGNTHMITVGQSRILVEKSLETCTLKYPFRANVPKSSKYLYEQCVELKTVPISDERCQVTKSMVKEKVASKISGGLLDNNLPIGSSVLPSLSMASCLILLHERCPIWLADAIFAVFCCLPSFLMTSLARMVARCKEDFWVFIAKGLLI